MHAFIRMVLSAPRWIDSGLTWSAYASMHTRREDDDLDIDAIIEANKDTLPTLPGAHWAHVIHHHILSNRRLPLSTD